MIIHNLKIAFRSLLKYKTQNIISIIGLAVGLVCFAFSALWIRYEMSYDNFHSNADRIYRVNTSIYKWDTEETGASEIVQRGMPYPMTSWLKSNFPEIEDATGIFTIGGGSSSDFSILFLDYSFSNIFDLNLSEDFFIHGRTNRPTALAPELVNEEVSQFIQERTNWDVRATLPRWQPNTNIRFNVASPLTSRFRNNNEFLNDWSSRGFDIFILLHDNVDLQAFEQKIDKILIPELWSNHVSLVLTPLTQLRYKDPTGNIQSVVKYAHIQIFAIAGLLVILSSLFNHLTLYVTRLRSRLRELALRKVNGATDLQIAATLFSDFFLVILLSLVFGFMLMTWFLPAFTKYASIENTNINI